MMLDKLTRTAQARRAEHDLEESVRENRRKIQNACSHRSCGGGYTGHSMQGQGWAIGLVHNRPDCLPHGICLLCSEWIEGNHWEDAGPSQIILVPAHKLYPVVLALDRRDQDLAVLRAKYEDEVDANFRHAGMRQHPSRIVEFEKAYQAEREKIIIWCETETRPWASLLK